MFYKVTFWIYFIVAGAIATLYFLSNGNADEFLILVLKSLGAALIVALVLNALVKLTVHMIRWSFNIGDYRTKYEARKKLMS